MAFLLESRVASFPRVTPPQLVNAEGVPVILPSSEWQNAFASARSFATVHWSATPELGLPVAPFIVDVSGAEISLNRLEDPIGNIQLDHAHGLTLDERNGLAAGLAPGRNYLNHGVFYLRFRAPPYAEIFALDLEGNEIAGSRQRAPVGGGPMMLFGPGIFGLRSTRPITLTDCRRGLIDDWTDIGWWPVAEVAPSIEGIPAYDQQNYLNVPRTAREALDDRTLADALARAGAVVPSHAELASRVHRADPQARIDNILASEFAAIIRNHFREIVADPTWTFTGQLNVPGSTPMDATFEPVALLQLLAASGPIDAYVLGGGVSFPTTTDYAFDESTAARRLDGAPDETPFPFPIVRVSGFFAGPGFQFGSTVAETRDRARRVEAVGRLIWPRAETRFSLRVGGPVAPATRDAHAQADVEIALAESPMPTVCYLARRIGAGTEALVNDVSGPKACVIADVDPPDPPDRIARIVDPAVALPLAASESVGYQLHRRDEFGRWSPAVPVTGDLMPWPVRRPALLSAEAFVDADIVYLELRMSWDWTHRTPREIRFGVHTTNDEIALNSLKPENGVTAPAFGTSQPLRLTFQSGAQPDQLPEVFPSQNATVRIVPRTEPDVDTVGISDVEITERTYGVRIRLGGAADVFTTADRVRVAAITDALEVVSGTRRSTASEKVFATAIDPRAPTIRATPWQLVWASRADPDNRARAVLTPPTLEGGRVAGFTAWRAHEASMFDFVLTERPDLYEAVASIRSEENMNARVALIQGLLEQLPLDRTALGAKLIPYFSVATSEFAPTEGVEVELPGTQNGLEFFLFTARSPNGVVSNKEELADIRAVAVPKTPHAARPMLSIITTDDRGTFAATGTCLLIVSAETPFEADRVRIFSDDRQDISSAEEVLKSLTRFWPLTVASAKAYVGDIDEVLARQPLPYRQLFLATPPRSWVSQSLTASIMPGITDSPSSDIPSPRSAIVTAVIAPATRPVLTQISREEPGDTVWTVGIKDLPVNSPVDESEILVEFESSIWGRKSRGAATLASLAVRPLEVLISGGKVSTRLLSSTTLEVRVNVRPVPGTVRLVAHDPQTRSAEILLQ